MIKCWSGIVLTSIESFFVVALIAFDVNFDTVSAAAIAAIIVSQPGEGDGALGCKRGQSSCDIERYQGGAESGRRRKVVRCQCHKKLLYCLST
jgi:hypothetical protein